jgi:hypothetical protein
VTKLKVFSKEKLPLGMRLLSKIKQASGAFAG